MRAQPQASPFGCRVVVTGMGAITPLGNCVNDFWEGLKAGCSGIDRIKSFDPTGYPSQIAGEVKADNLYDLIPTTVHTCPLPDYPHRGVLLTLIAASEALLQSGLEPHKWNPDRVGLYLSNGCGTVDLHNLFVGSQAAIVDGKLSYDAFMKKGIQTFIPEREHSHEADKSLKCLSEGWNILGPCSVGVTACAASSQTIGEASHWIGSGKADIVLTGGAQAIVDPFGVTGFGHLTALSTRNDDPQRASRPFDADRDGFVIAEGAGILVLESLEHAQTRGAEILGEVRGFGLSTDAYRVTDPEPTGETCAAAIWKALSSARLSPDDIDVINAHGTSTQANDRTETVTIKRVFGERSYKIPVHSIKSMIGHTVTASGVLEAITAFLTIRDGIVPPTINQEVSDPECDLDYVPNVARAHKARVVVSNSFGFGGQNVSLVLSGGF